MRSADVALYGRAMSVTLFLVERYVPRLDVDALARIAALLCKATAALRREGHDIRWVQSIALPGDDTCLCLFRASGSELVLEANRRVGLELERVSEALGSRTVGLSLTPSGPASSTLE